MEFIFGGGGNIWSYVDQIQDALIIRKPKQRYVCIYQYNICILVALINFHF